MQSCSTNRVLKEKRKIIKSNRGSSSVLVILIMVTLVVLGLMALMSTFSGLKLARKNAEWVKTYYVLDGKAENLLSGIDSCLKDASGDAGKYISDKAYEKAENGTLPANIQTAVHTGWNNALAANTEEKYLQALYNRLYYMYCLNNLKASDMKDLQIYCDLDFENAALFEETSELEDGAVTVSSTVQDETVPDGRRLLIAVSLKPVDKVTLNSGESGEFYEITAWKEIPKKFEYEDVLDFEDLEVE